MTRLWFTDNEARGVITDHIRVLVQLATDINDVELAARLQLACDNCLLTDPVRHQQNDVA